MLEIGALGAVGNPTLRHDDLEKELREPTPDRVFALPEAMKQGYSVERIHELTHVDK